MKAFAICEIDVGTNRDIVHSLYIDVEIAKRELRQLEENPQCEIPFYLMEGEFTITKSAAIL